jgi:hypothetical protein
MFKYIKDQLVSLAGLAEPEPVGDPVEMSLVRKYGWIRDQNKPEALQLNFFKGYNTTQIDLRSKMPPVYDQGHLGSCTSNAIAAVYEHWIGSQETSEAPCPRGAPCGSGSPTGAFKPSRLFIYYNERLIENSIDTDAGAMIKDGFYSLDKYGVCPEYDYPYIVSRFKEKPSETAYLDATKHECHKYSRLEVSVANFKQALFLGHPVGFGFVVSKSFELIGSDGIMKIPDKYEDILGGHAVVACGFDDTKTHNGSTGFLLVRNSWSSNWGLSGYFWMPYDFINDVNCDDCWIIGPHVSEGSENATESEESEIHTEDDDKSGSEDSEDSEYIEDIE